MTAAAHRAATLDDLTIDPHPILAAARAEAPIAWVPAYDGWVVTGRAAAIEVMRDADRFTVDDPRFSTAQVIGPSMLSTDGDRHTHHRSPFTDWFSSRERLAESAAWMQRCASSIVAEFIPAGEAELRTELAAPLAARTLAHLLGLDPPGAEQLLAWYREIVDAVQRIATGDDAGAAGPEAFTALRRAVLTAADDGRAAALLDARSSLSDDELAANAAVILFGGIETSEGATTSAFAHLLAEPANWAALRADPSLVAAAVEESLRLEPAAANVDRYATVDVELGGASIRAGDYVVVSLAGANRDPAVFDDPDRFRLDRPNARQHTTFAMGAHACLGIHIARAQTAAAITAMLRLGDVELDESRSAPPHGLVFRKPPAVTATWSRP
ncbi:MAG: cytochrome P450 [Actinomycetota bacterium]